MTRYRGRHRSQYDLGASARLRSMGCTPTSLANGLRVATGGKVNMTGDQVLAKVAIREETNPATSGWSLEDASLAASRISGAPPLGVSEGSWSDVVAAAGVYAVLLQGDSDQFSGGCAGAFDGNHCILLHPDKVSGQQWTGDPICPDWRLEWPSTLQRYSQKLFGLRVKFGVLFAQVPNVGVTPPDTGTQPGGGNMPGLKLTDGASYSGTIEIRSGAKFYPLVLDGVVGGTLPAVTKRAFSTAYSPKLRKRLFVVGDEFAGVDVQDVLKENHEPWT